MKGVLAIMVLVLALAACSAPSPPLRVGLLAWPPYEIAKLADSLGYFGEGRIEIVEFESPAEARRAYSVGSLDLVALTLDYAFDLGIRADEDRVILLIDESRGGDAVIGRTRLDRLADLRGMRIGMEPGPLGAHMLRSLLTAAQLRPSDVTLVHLDIPDQSSAFASNDIDAVITYEPVRTELINRGGVELFSSRQMPGEIVDAFIARARDVEDRTADFRHFTSGWFRALDELRSNPADSIARMASSLGMTEDDFSAALQGVYMMDRAENRSRLAGAHPGFIDRARETAAANDFAGDAWTSSAIHDMFTTHALPEAPAPHD